MGLVGAILGDISGSQFEFNRCKDPINCELFSIKCNFTDDTVTSLAMKDAIHRNISFEESMVRLGRLYPNCGYGGRFYRWLKSKKHEPYNSFGNGSAMRVSYIGEYYEDLNDVIDKATESAMFSHNHPEGVKGAVTTAVCVWMAKHGKTKDEIYDYVLSQYPASDYDFSIDKDMEYLRQNYSWDVTCMTSVTVAMRCFYESDSYTSFLRNVFSLDCDSDTLAAIGGGVAEEFYKGTGLENDKLLELYLDNRLLAIVNMH